MASVNKVIILGNLGADPELRYTPNQVPVVRLNVATKDFRTTADGQRQETTEWHRVTVWSKLAENCAKYLAKGRAVYIEGRLQTRSWDDKDGTKKYATEIIANTVQFIGGGQGGSAGSGPRDGGARPFNGQSAGGGFSSPSSMGGSGGDSPFSGMDSPDLDEIPF